jgi:hypothetical protein
VGSLARTRGLRVEGAWAAGPGSLLGVLVDQTHVDQLVEVDPGGVAVQPDSTAGLHGVERGAGLLEHLEQSQATVGSQGLMGGGGAMSRWARCHTRILAQSYGKNNI